MKKIIALTLAMLLLLTLASCGKKEAEPTTEAATVPTEAPVETPTEAPTEEPAPTEPEWEPGVSRAGYGEAVYDTLCRGDEITVIGEWKDYYVIEGEEVDLLIEKRFVRLSSEEPFEAWNGYARYQTKIYDNVYMYGDPIVELYQNKLVNVIDGGEGWLLVQWDDNTGYVDADKISRWPISSGKSSGGSGSSGNSGSSSESSEASGDINLDRVAYYGPEKTDVEDTGLVLADNVSAILCITIRDDEVKVTAADEEVCELYLEGYTATVPRWLLRLEGDEEYEPWTGYAKWSAVVWEEFQMRNERKTLTTNTEVLVLDELPDCYVVEVDGEIGYAALDMISQNRFYTSGGGSGSGSNSGNSGSGSSGGSSSGTSDTWTPPIV